MHKTIEEEADSLDEGTKRRKSSVAHATNEAEKKRGRKSIATPAELKKETSNDVYSFKSTSSDEDQKLKDEALKQQQLLQVKQDSPQAVTPKTTKRKSIAQEKKPAPKVDDTETESATDNDKDDILDDLEYFKLNPNNTSSSVVRKENICFICEFPEDLIECQGTCMRHVHHDCIGLLTKPKHGYKCDECAANSHACFACKKPSEKNFETKKCSLAKCGRYYHDECAKQSLLFKKDSNSKYTCSLHTCATCHSESNKFTPDLDQNEVTACLQAHKGPFYECVKCPTAYHVGDLCLAAGSVILAGCNIICPRHFKPIKGCSHHSRVSVSWCFVCTKSDDLIGCSSCPAAYHLNCLNSVSSNLIASLKRDEDVTKSPQASTSSSRTQSPASSISSTSTRNDWLCEDCLKGERPVTGQIVWAKAGSYRWWPAQVCHSRNLPSNLQNKTFQVGEYPVKFFGTNDYYWINVGRCFTFHEGDELGDKTGQNNRGKTLEHAYYTGLRQASLAFKEIRKAKIERMTRVIERGEGVFKNLKKSYQDFQFIKTNRVYGNANKMRQDISDVNVCSCDPKSKNPCGTDDCLNRILKYECNPRKCAAGDRCQNQRFVKRIYPKQTPFKTGSRGTGLRTSVDIKKGEFVNEYVGEIIDDDECKRRLQYAYENDICNFYFLTIDKDRIIDAGLRGNNCRFMNHSCDPNCETQKWQVNGDIRVGLFAVKDIPAGSELTFNYNLDCLSNAKAECKCGAANCSGFIGERPKKVEEIGEQKVLKVNNTNSSQTNSANGNTSKENTTTANTDKRVLKSKQNESTVASNNAQKVKARSKSAAPKIDTLKQSAAKIKLEKLETSSTTSSTSSSSSTKRKSRI